MLKIVGDINFTDGFFDTGFGVGSSIEKGLDPFHNLERNNSDFWIGNFECVCAGTSNKTGLYRKQFIISPDTLSHINHLNLYSVANNHVMQHGEKAYKELLDFLDAEKCAYVGTDKKRSTVFDHQNKTIGLIAFSQRFDNFSKRPLYWSFPEYKEIENELAKLAKCDFKIAYIHWGNEFISYPYTDQRQFAHWLIDLGFDLIVGVHPHVLQGYEIYKKKYIFYSLGNFVFNMPWAPTQYSIILNVDFQTETPEVSYDYVHLDKNYSPQVISPECMPQKYSFQTLNKNVCKVEENEVYYAMVYKCMREYRRENYKTIIRNIYRYRMIDIILILKDFIIRKFL